MELNDNIKERYARKLLDAIEDADLTNAETAERFDFNASYLSHIKRSDNFHRVPPKAWERIRQWYYSDTFLKDYKWKEMPIGDIKLTVKESETANNVVAEIRAATEKKKVKNLKHNSRRAVAELKKQHEEMSKAIAESVNTEEHIDIDKINQRTGTRVMIDILEGGYIITVTNLPK